MDHFLVFFIGGARNESDRTAADVHRFAMHWILDRSAWFIPVCLNLCYELITYTYDRAIRTTNHKTSYNEALSASFHVKVFYA